MCPCECCPALSRPRPTRLLAAVIDFEAELDSLLLTRVSLDTAVLSITHTASCLPLTS